MIASVGPNQWGFQCAFNLFRYSYLREQVLVNSCGKPLRYGASQSWSGGFQPCDSLLEAVTKLIFGGISHPQFRQAVAKSIPGKAEGAGGLALVSACAAEGFANC